MRLNVVQTLQEVLQDALTATSNFSSKPAVQATAAPMAAAQKLGGGLIEISAVATIVGAPIAEALVHGLKGACGLAWAPLSSFGAIHVTKACLSASVPDWMREALGLRNQFVDEAIGVMLDINQYKQSKHRIDLGDANAVQISSAANSFRSLFRPKSRKPAIGLQDPEKGRRRRSSNDQRMASKYQRPNPGQVIYKMDKNSYYVLNSISAAEKGKPVKLHRFMPDYEGIVPAWKDYLVILLSAAKLIEVFTLRELKSEKLWACTMGGWVHAFCSALLLQMCGLGRDSPIRCDRDLVSGVLPSAIHLGESGRIIINTPANVRRHPLWRTVLAVGVLFNAAQVFSTFIFLSSEPSLVIYVWVGFQVLWLISRSFVFYFVEGAGAARQGLIVGKSWEESAPEDRLRAMNLFDELSKHQASCHPRSAMAYTDDCLSFSYLGLLFAEVDWKLRTSADYEKAPAAGIEIKAVTGDCLIRTGVWFSGLDLDPNPIYDSCIAFLATPDGTMAVSCVRVYTCLCTSNFGRERGNANHSCGQLEWAYFIPNGDNIDCSWIFAHGRCGVGILSTEVLNSEELDRRLSVGWWKISIQSLQELQTVLAVSQAAGQNVLRLLQVEAGADTTEKVLSKAQRVQTDVTEITMLG